MGVAPQVVRGGSHLEEGELLLDGHLEHADLVLHVQLQLCHLHPHLILHRRHLPESPAAGPSADSSRSQGTIKGGGHKAASAHKSLLQSGQGLLRLEHLLLQDLPQHSRAPCYVRKGGLREDLL